MTADDFVKSLKILPAKRLEKAMKATVQASGRLVFATDAIKAMELNENKGIKIYETDTMDLGAMLTDKDDPEAFTLKRNGPYFYVYFKNFLQEKGIDYRNKRIVYDITDLGKRFQGQSQTIYKFEYRELANGPMQLHLPVPGADAKADDGEKVPLDDGEPQPDPDQASDEPAETPQDRPGMADGEVAPWDAQTTAPSAPAARQDGQSIDDDMPF